MARRVGLRLHAERVVGVLIDQTPDGPALGDLLLGEAAGDQDLAVFGERERLETALTASAHWPVGARRGRECECKGQARQHWNPTTHAACPPAYPSACACGTRLHAS